jgi:hypothetical protein
MQAIAAQSSSFTAIAADFIRTLTIIYDSNFVFIRPVNCRIGIWDNLYKAEVLAQKIEYF